MHTCFTLQEVEVYLLKSEVGLDNEITLYILQNNEYPLLIKKRKFIIKCFGLITSINGIMNGYFYKDGYICLAPNVYNLNNSFGL